MTEFDEERKARPAAIEVCEDYAIAWFAARELSQLTVPDAIYATLAFRRGWMRHLIHQENAGKVRRRAQLQKMAETSCANLGVPLTTAQINAWILGFNCRGLYVKGNSKLP